MAYSAAEARRLQAIADADPAVQAAYRQFMAIWNQGGRGDARARTQARDALTAAINRNPALRAAKVGEGTIGAGYQWQQGAPRFTINREGGDWGHVIRDIILPAAGAGAIVAAPVIMGSQAARGPAAAQTAASEAGPVYGYGAGAAELGGAAPTAGAGVGTAATTAGSGLAGGLTDFLTDPQALAGLGAVIGGLTTGNDSPGAEEIARINAITEAQARRADPLHRIAVNLAYGRMPTQYRQGVPLPDVPLPR